ncbi:unnamed protein product [Staurois parvus]|uniref:Uncharacterized protein n=1 Tax=Staurois parvus TaxID=386267 RepID=A0ABN9DGK1_9NEOB|nr:unnamed protein product [Staurois parvus]
MGDIERQLRWALICGIDVHWYALICGTGTWHFWSHTEHQGTLIITVSVTAREERNAVNRHFRVYM